MYYYYHLHHHQDDKQGPLVTEVAAATKLPLNIYFSTETRPAWPSANSRKNNERPVTVEQENRRNRRRRGRHCARTVCTKK